MSADEQVVQQRLEEDAATIVKEFQLDVTFSPRASPVPKDRAPLGLTIHRLAETLRKFRQDMARLRDIGVETVTQAGLSLSDIGGAKEFGIAVAVYALRAEVDALRAQQRNSVSGLRDEVDKEVASLRDMRQKHDALLARTVAALLDLGLMVVTPAGFGLPDAIDGLIAEVKRLHAYAAEVSDQRDEKAAELAAIRGVREECERTRELAVGVLLNLGLPASMPGGVRVSDAFNIMSEEVRRLRTALLSAAADRNDKAERLRAYDRCAIRDRALAELPPIPDELVSTQAVPLTLAELASELRKARRDCARANEELIALKAAPPPAKKPEKRYERGAQFRYRLASSEIVHVCRLIAAGTGHCLLLSDADDCTLGQILQWWPTLEDIRAALGAVRIEPIEEEAKP